MTQVQVTLVLSDQMPTLVGLPGLPSDISQPVHGTPISKIVHIYTHLSPKKTLVTTCIDGDSIFQYTGGPLTKTAHAFVSIY